VLNHPGARTERGYFLAPMRRGIRLTTGAEFALRDAIRTPVQHSDGGTDRPGFVSACGKNGCRAVDGLAPRARRTDAGDRPGAAPREAVVSPSATRTTA
jgi:hypothetical protein